MIKNMPIMRIGQITIQVKMPKRIKVKATKMIIKMVTVTIIIMVTVTIIIVEIKMTPKMPKRMIKILVIKTIKRWK